MYSSPPPLRTSGQVAKFVLRIALLLGLVPWTCLVLYAGIGGNLVTMALGLPNRPFIVKIAATLGVVALSWLPVLWAERALRPPYDPDEHDVPDEDRPGPEGVGAPD